MCKYVCMCICVGTCSQAWFVARGPECDTDQLSCKVRGYFYLSPRTTRVVMIKTSTR